MATTYLVTAPFVNATVEDDNGAKVTLAFYRDQTIENAVEGDHLDKLVRAGYVEKASGSKASSSDDGGPAKSAPKGDWEAYARSQGASDEDLEGATKDDIIATYGD